MTIPALPAVRLLLRRGHLFYTVSGQRCRASRLSTPYALAGPEGIFARELLRARTQFWLFRTHQQQRAGDFIALDRSPGAAQGVGFAIELKASSALKVGWRGTQLGECERAVRWLEVQHCLSIERVLPVVGEHQTILQLLRRASKAP